MNNKRTLLQILKRIVLYILVLPQIVIHKIRGIEYNFDFLASFFRYFPLGVIHKNKSVNFRFNKKKIIFYYDHQNPLSAGIFGNNEYSILPVKNLTVVDIGAALGDTAIYFSLKGAEKVYAYELNFKNYSVALKNIKANNLEKKIEIYYCGIGKSKIKATDEVLGAVMNKREFKSVKNADFMTIDQIVTSKNIVDGVLKVDVDGYEYDIFNSTTKKTLRKFKYIFLEFHFGLKNLKEILEDANFHLDIKYVSSYHINHHPKGYKDMEIGYIFASRI